MLRTIGSKCIGPEASKQAAVAERVRVGPRPTTDDATGALKAAAAATFVRVGSSRYIHMPAKKRCAIFHGLSSQ